MRLLAETVVLDVLPAVRALLAKDLIDKYGMTQKDAAARLGLTQAAVSQYRRNLRGYKVEILKKDEKIVSEIEKLSKRLASAESISASEELSRLCKIIAGRDVLKEIHNVSDLEISQTAAVFGNE